MTHNFFIILFWGLIAFFVFCGPGVTCQSSSSINLAEGQNHVVYCHYQPSSFDIITWRINNLPQSFYPNNQVVKHRLNDTSCLNLTDVQPVYNDTTIKCIGQRSSVEVTLLTTRLLVQGPLEAVSLFVTIKPGITESIPISWTAPFSLNLTTAEPDIQYCVDVYNVTGGGDLVESRCDITETFYTYTPDNPSPDHVFNFTVTPRSNVEGALNGTTSEPVQGYVIRVPLSIPADKFTFRTNTALQPIQFLFPIQILGTSPGQKPTGYNVSLQYVDFGPASPCSCPTSYSITDNIVTLTLLCDSMCKPQRHRIANATIIAYNGVGNSSSHPEMEISTHTIQHVRAISSSRGQIDLSYSYLTGAGPGIGIFTILFALSNRSDVVYRVAHRNGQELTTTLSVVNLQNKEYKVAAYDLVNFVPELVPAATPQTVNMDTHNGIREVNETLVSPLLTPPVVTVTDDGRICINCSFSDPVIGCVGVIHPAELDNLILTAVLPVSRITFNSDMFYISNCTDEVLVPGDYNVAVFGQLTDRLETAPAFIASVTVEPYPTSDPTTQPTDHSPYATVIALVVGILTAGTVFLVVIIVVIIFVSKRIKSSPQPHTDIQMCSIPERTVQTQMDVDDSPPRVVQRKSPATKKEAESTPDSSLIEIDEQLFHSKASPHYETVDPPTYNVAKIVIVKQATSSEPLFDSTITEHQYCNSEIGGAINEYGLHYATPKPKPEGLPDQPVDPTAVIYSQVVKDKVVPEAKDSKEVPLKELATSNTSVIPGNNESSSNSNPNIATSHSRASLSPVVSRTVPATPNMAKGGDSGIGSRASLSSRTVPATPNTAKGGDSGIGLSNFCCTDSGRGTPLNEQKMSHLLQTTSQAHIAGGIEETYV